MKTKITLKELSKLLNVSVSTVSKALNNSPEISEKTISRVKELAKFHNYRPNPTAVNLKSSKSGTIGVIIPNISNPFFANVLSGIEAEAQKSGFQVITYISNESLEREKQISEMLTSGFVDGVLIAISEETQRKKQYEHLFNIVEYEIPIVLYDRVNLDIKADKIGVDDEQSFEEATRLLLSKGAKKIGIASAIHHLSVGKSRISGYKKALRNKDYLTANSSRPEVLKGKIKTLLRKDKVDALLCSDVDSTMQVYRLAHEFGIKIPEELKIIGFLPKGVAPFLYPSVSYIDQFPEKIGKNAVGLLVNRINKKPGTEEPREVVIHTKLVHLESSGMAKP